MRAGEPRPVAWTIALGGAGLLAILFVRTAWMCDDAYITLRTVDNLIGGFGLRWNVAERVQAFTHPAWALFVAPFYAITREAYFTVLALQIAIATVTVALCGRLVARSAADALVAFAAFAASKAFVEFSTSGLENALAHALIVLFVIVWRRDRTEPGGLLRLGLLTSGLLLCRLDLIALVGPMVLVAIRPLSRTRLSWFLAGLAPFTAWELFSLVYYGQVVANTALAKLPAGVSFIDLAGQGSRYFAATFHFDPTTPLVIALAVAGLVWRGGRPGRAIAAGVLLHCAYIVTVGGDFMTGRFLTPAFVLAVAGAVGFVSWPGPARVRPFAAGLLVAAGLVPQASPLRTGAGFGEVAPPAAEFDRFGVTDERRFYYPSLGLLRVLQGRAVPADHSWAAAGREERTRAAGAGPQVRQASNTGLFGFYAGPSVYIIDRNALSDPFLARLPPRPGWRVGHYTRDVPPEYEESRRQDQNRLQDAELRRLYDQVQLVTRGGIWSGARLRAIAELMWGNSASR